VRNALVPVRGTLEAVLTTAPPGSRERIERARMGVVRVLTFVDQLVATTEMISEPATASTISDLTREAIEHVDADDRVTVLPAAETVEVEAPRSRLVMTLANVIRNALQFAPAPAAIRVSWWRVDDALELAVDDGGPGVAERDRNRVFDEGFTTRPGGSGFGLAFARKFVEGTLRGTIRCEDSDLGGARFVITLPLQRNQ
jgi:signal transduction histidine kinase